jgi:S1-C subfamily serine protease
MKINNKLKEKINNSVVRIIAEDISINWHMPYMSEEPSKGQGSGFFIDLKGHILTCAHVVNGSKNLYIEIPSLGSEKHECTVVGICPHFDIALLKTKKYIPKEYLLLGDSDKLEVGNEVQVVGYPVSYKSSSNNINNLKYTIGIISGQQKGLIQTDSAINPGNSGGPLFCDNKIIGINSRKLVGESLENIGYAVPINNYKVIMNDLLKDEIVYRPNLLLKYNNTNEHILKDITNNKINKGIIVSKISKNSLLHKSNIKKDCIITQINNFHIDNIGLTDYRWLGTQIDIDILLNKFKNNDIISIKYYNNETRKVELEKVKLVPYIPVLRVMYPVFEKIPYFILGGIIFMNFCYNHLNASENENLDLLCVAKKNDLKKPKIFVSFIFPNTIANILNNIKKDDFIVKVNDISVNSLNKLKNIIKKPLIINKKEYIKIENSNGKSLLMPLKEMIEQDLIFSEIYKYPLNDIHKK